MAFGIEEQVLGLDVTMCDALAVEVGYSIQYLLETALDFAGAHSTARKSIVSTRFKSKVRDVSMKTKSSSADGNRVQQRQARWKTRQVRKYIRGMSKNPRKKKILFCPASSDAKDRKENAKRNAKDEMYLPFLDSGV